MSNKKRDKKMYIIIERSGGRTFCYVEDHLHHQVAERSRQEDGFSRVGVEALDRECDIEQSLAPDTYIVVPMGLQGG